MSAELFDAAWLALREPVDHRSRAGSLIPPLADWWRAQRCSRVLDLGSGTGSNLRYLSPLLPGEQEWTLLDHDRALLERVRAPAAKVRVRTLNADLAEGGIAEARGAHLVTASALLDLVSEHWLSTLATVCSENGCGALFALSYDGTIEWGSKGPSRPQREGAGDDLVREAVNAHQVRDKGVGRALGPAAAATAERLFRGLGYRTWLLPAAWTLGPSDAELAGALVAGWATAAAEMRPDAKGAIESWAERSKHAIAAGDFSVTVGHQDLLALPPTP